MLMMKEQSLIVPSRTIKLCLCGNIATQDSHCNRCYMLYVKRQLIINGQRWHVRPGGTFDFFVFPVLAWYPIGRVATREGEPREHYWTGVHNRS